MEPRQLLTPDSFYDVKFTKADVLTSFFDKKERLKKLVAAMKLGNNHKMQVRIFFMNANDQLVEIQAKVWSVTEKYVVLKNDIMIPISSIQDVNYV